MKENKKIVVIGGGNGSAISLRALKRLDGLDLKAVVSMSDSGGSSGRLRREFNTLPAGDVLRAVLALSIYDYKFLKHIFHEIRFTGSGKLDRHNLGNLFLVLGEKLDGSWPNAIRALEQAVEAQGEVLPTTLDRTDLVVELSDGTIIKGEGVIDRPDYDRGKKIKKAWLEPEAKIYLGAKKSLEEADYIFLGPGSLYCSVIATILPTGIKEALEKTKAKLIYLVGNAYELIGETGPTSLSSSVLELEEYLPRKLDFIVYNNHKLNSEQLERYNKKGWDLLKPDLENIDKQKLIQGDYEKEEGGLDPDKLSKILKDIIK